MEVDVLDKYLKEFSQENRVHECLTCKGMGHEEFLFLPILAITGAKDL